MPRKLNLKIGFINAQSLNTGNDELLYTIGIHKPDILGITETRITKKSNLKYYQIDGYKFFQTFRGKGRKREGGGIGIYIRENFRARKINIPVNNFEQLWLEIKLKNLKVAFGVFYRPPRYNFNSCLEHLEDALSELSPQYDYTFLTGDINIDLLLSDEPNQRKFLRMLNDNNLYQTVSEATRVTDSTGTQLDVICCSINMKPKSILVLHNDDLSDHSFVQAEFPIKLNNPPPRKVIYRPFNSFGLDTYNFAASITPWDWVLTYDDIDSMVDCFKFLILGLFDHFVPLRTRTFKSPPMPWNTDSIRALMRDRDRAANKAKRAKVDTIRDKHKKEYQCLRNLVKELQHKEKTQFFTLNVNANISKPRRMWSEIDKIIGEPKKSVIPQHLCDPNLINKTFLESIPNIDSTNQNYNSNFNSTPNTFSFESCTEDDIYKTITSISSNSSGSDGISMKMIKLTLPHSLTAITAIINKSLTSGIFPNSWKTSIIKPIPKKNPVESLTDLRPIGILPALSKVLEKIINSQLMKHLEENQLIPEHQSGFRKNHSTTTALIQIVDEILANSNNNQASILVLLDYSRAFDCLLRNILLDKLKQIGCDELVCKWFSSYLSDRMQIVECCDDSGNTVRSSAIPVTRGVVQGSVIGPTLYSIYTYDLLPQLKHCVAHMYADDTQVIIQTELESERILNAVDLLNSDLEVLSKWSTANGLLLNAKKCLYMILGSSFQIQKARSNCPPILINNCPIEESFLARNLGILFDPSLKFEKHINSKIPTCYYSLKKLYKIRPFLSVAIRQRLIEALVLSHLDFGDLVYGPCLNATVAKRVQKVQNSCIRFCFSVPPRSHITPFLNSYNIMNMSNRRKFKYYNLIYKLRITNVPPYLAKKLFWSDRDATRRYPSRYPTLRSLRPRRETFRGSFRFAASKCWNDLPPPIKTASSFYTFKRMCKNWLITNQKSACCWTAVGKPPRKLKKKKQ